MHCSLPCDPECVQVRVLLVTSKDVAARSQLRWYYRGVKIHDLAFTSSQDRSSQPQ